jgi:hypothetical protein
MLRRPGLARPFLLKLPIEASKSLPLKGEDLKPNVAGFSLHILAYRSDKTHVIEPEGAGT